MTEKSWTEMGLRDRDIWIAQTLFQLIVVPNFSTVAEARFARRDQADPPDRSRYLYADEVLHYSSEPAPDYAVLEHVRATWSEEQLTGFAEALFEIWKERDPDGACGLRGGHRVVFWLPYQKGDYSQAAYLAMTNPGLPRL